MSKQKLVPKKSASRDRPSPKRDPYAPQEGSVRPEVATNAGGIAPEPKKKSKGRTSAIEAYDHEVKVEQLAARGLPPAVIAQGVGLHPASVRKILRRLAKRKEKLEAKAELDAGLVRIRDIGRAAMKAGQLGVALRAEALTASILGQRAGLVAPAVEATTNPIEELSFEDLLEELSAGATLHDRLSAGRALTEHAGEEQPGDVEVIEAAAVESDPGETIRCDLFDLPKPRTEGVPMRASASTPTRTEHVVVERQVVTERVEVHSYDSKNHERDLSWNEFMATPEPTPPAAPPSRPPTYSEQVSLRALSRARGRRYPTE